MYLSPEILMNIVSHLHIEPTFEFDFFGEYDDYDPEEDKIKLRTLRSLCLSSKTLCAITHPVLYHTIDFRLHTRQPEGNAGSLWDLLRTLKDDRALADHVRSIHVTTIWYCESLGRDEIDSREPLTTELITSLDSEKQDPDLITAFKLELSEALETATTDGGLALLLVWCKNLQVLNFRDNAESEESIMIGLLKWIGPSLRARGSESSLSTSVEENVFDASSRDPRDVTCGKLKQIHISTRHTEGFIDFETYCELLSLPALELFSGVSLSLLYEPELLVNLSLRYLNLEQSNICPQSWHDLFRAFPNLDTFEVHWGDESRNDASVEMSYIDLGNALRKHAKKLRWLQIEMLDEHRYREDYDHGRIGSLACLSTLEYLHIPRIAFFAELRDSPAAESLPLCDALPKSLQHLHLFTQPGYEPDDAESWEDMELFKLMARSDNLKYIRTNRFESLDTISVPDTWVISLSLLEDYLPYEEDRERMYVLERIATKHERLDERDPHASPCSDVVPHIEPH